MDYLQHSTPSHVNFAAISPDAIQVESYTRNILQGSRKEISPPGSGKGLLEVRNRDSLEILGARVGAVVYVYVVTTFISVVIFMSRRNKNT